MNHNLSMGLTAQVTLTGRLRRVGIGAILLPLFASTAIAQNQRGELAQPTDASQSSGITSSQADAILKELQLIRQLLEKQEAQGTQGLVPQRIAPAPSDKVQMSIESGWHAIGNPDAPVTLVEFVDFQCPFCKSFHSDTFPELKKDYIDTGKVRFISRDLPLEFHPYAFKAAEAVRCAGDQQKYWELRSVILNTDEWNDQLLQSEGGTLSLNLNRFQICMDSEKYKVDVQKDSDEARTLQISGTPTFVLAKTTKDTLDGTRIIGAQPFSTFRAAINALLNK